MMRLVLRAVAFACLLGGGLAHAQSVPGWLSKISVHGYVSQAYAVSEDHPIFGIPTGGTTDYRDIALQFRYDPNRKNAVVVQFRHERFGELRMDDAENVELDWAFYQHNFSDRLSLKAGRIPCRSASSTKPPAPPPPLLSSGRPTSSTIATTRKTVEGVLTSACSVAQARGASTSTRTSANGCWTNGNAKNAPMQRTRGRSCG
jgi:hypothetical protein